MHLLVKDIKIKIGLLKGEIKLTKLYLNKSYVYKRRTKSPKSVIKEDTLLPTVGNRKDYEKTL